VVPHTINLKILTLSAIILLAVGTPGYAACNVVDGKAYGDCAGVRFNDGIKGHLTVRTYISESGIIDGATVLNGGELDLSGISNGNITVHEGARLRMSGVVNGTVTNLGGNIEIEGTLDHLHTTGGEVVIGGSVGSISGSGSVSYKKGAVVGGVPFKKAVRKK
jgi:hypothetical protein